MRRQRTRIGSIHKELPFRKRLGARLVRHVGTTGRERNEHESIESQRVRSRSTKSQNPNPKEAPITKLQKRIATNLIIGAWDFFGSLGFGLGNFHLCTSAILIGRRLSKNSRVFAASNSASRASMQRKKRSCDARSNSGR